MPCTKCEEGNYKWGKTGECKYDSLDACESANSKYSKMKPTPLGKKTYEEYAKELKEFNLSSQRFDFNDIKTLNKLTAQLDKLMDTLSNDEPKIKDAVSDYEKFNQNEKIASESLEKEFNNYKALEKRQEEIEKEKKSAQKEYDKKEKVYDKARDKKETMAMKVFKTNDKYKASYKKGESIMDKLEDATIEVRKQAKALGVDVPTNKFENSIVQFKNLQENPLNKINFDY
tara:strand:- start:24 stop:713 length:690 start_codon:yes stop_codon:yes gene_type:complete